MTKQRKTVIKMSLWELFILAVGLSMDAFAVSVCKGLSVKKLKAKHMLTVGAYFGGFQALMPLLGYILGIQFQSMIRQFDHWIAFVLLVLIGLSMIKESREEAENLNDSFSFKTMLPLAVATSIDALAVGLSFSLLNINVWGPSTLIGVVCAVITALGLLAGKGLAHADIFGRRAELVGGCVLIGIGLKILYEHGVLS